MPKHPCLEVGNYVQEQRRIRRSNTFATLMQWALWLASVLVFALIIHHYSH